MSSVRPLAVLLAPLLVAGCFEALAQETPRTNVLIEIGRPGERAVPIAIPMPKGSGPNDEFWTVVRRDLELSGWFRVLDANASLEPTTAGIRLGEFDFADWRPTGATILAKTSLAATDDKLRTEVWIYGVDGGVTLAR